LRAVDLGGGLAQPQPHAQVDQRAAQLDAALAADDTVAAFAGRLLLDRVETGGAVDLPVVVEPGRVTQRPAVVPGPDRAPARDRHQGREGAARQQPGQLFGGLLDLSVQVAQQREVSGQDSAGDRGVCGGQCIAGGLDEPVGHRPPACGSADRGSLRTG